MGPTQKNGNGKKNDVKKKENGNGVNGKKLPTEGPALLQGDAETIRRNYERLKDLGMSDDEIASRLKLSPETLQKMKSLEQLLFERSFPPVPQGRSKRSRLLREKPKEGSSEEDRDSRRSRYAFVHRKKDSEE